MRKFRKKPVVVEAMQWDGRTSTYQRLQGVSPTCSVQYGPGTILYVNTLEGQMRAEKGDWIILGVNKELYSCKPDIFERTYDAA
jgi:hypothetical protein